MRLEAVLRLHYGEFSEAIPPNAPEPRGKDVDLRIMHCDSDHAGDKLTRRSRSGLSYT